MEFVLASSCPDWAMEVDANDPNSAENRICGSP